MRIFVIILAVIGGLAILVVVGLVGLFMLGMQQLKPIIEDGTAYANQSIRAIATDWDAEQLLNRASPEMLAVLDQQQIDQFISFGRNQLGRMVDYQDNANCIPVRYEYTAGEGEVAVLGCTASATFERATGMIELGAIKRDGIWQLTGMFIDAEASESMTRTARTTPAPRLANFEVSLVRKSIALETDHLPAVHVGATTSADHIYLDLSDMFIRTEE